MITYQKIGIENHSYYTLSSSIIAVRAVVKHESALKAQAKKMNVESLRSNQVPKLLFLFEVHVSVQILNHKSVGFIQDWDLM